MKSSLFSIFNNYPNLICDISGKKDGAMSSPGFLVGKFDNPKIAENRKNFFRKMRTSPTARTLIPSETGITPESVVTVGSLHNSNVKMVSRKDTGKIIKDIDGLLTNEKNLFLSLTVADCLPVYLYDPRKEVVGLLHGGWKGVAKDILVGAVEKISANFGSCAEDILVAIGPGISQCHFEIKEDVLVNFSPFLLKKTLIKRDKKMFLDLKKIVQIQLLGLGLKKENIEISPDCTFCLHDKYFSYRREKSEIPKTMIAVIGIKQFA